ncbi:hypothetical protein HA402_011526 [Bradysia odoriphaga]|nr:hypothetical protein HA402_011526 [Bradysia odoriphaga]
MPDQQTKVIVGTAVVVGTAAAAGLAYFYARKRAEPIPTKWKKVGKVSDLNFFPVKSCAPIKCNSLRCHNLGVECDELVDRGFIISRNNKQVTARVYPNMLLIQPKLEGSQLTLSAPGRPNYNLDLDDLRKRLTKSEIECWYSKVVGIDAGDHVGDWLSEFIVGQPGIFRLSFYPHKYSTKGIAKPDRKYKEYLDADAGSYHDKTSYMLINQGSIDQLNSELDHVVTPLQFRPNLLIEGPGAYDEDSWKWVRIGDNVVFRVLKPCTRCILTNINPETGKRHPEGEPLKTLVKTRTILPNEPPVIGIQMGVRVRGSVSIGDAVYVNDESSD